MGKAIYLGYDRAALDAQYNNRLRVPDFADLFRALEVVAARRRRRQLGGRGAPGSTSPTGPSALEKLDIFPAKDRRRRQAADPGVHPRRLLARPGQGGFQLTRPRRTFEAGITYIPINYGLTPADFTWTRSSAKTKGGRWPGRCRNPQAHGGDIDRLYVSGHPAGGQLAPMVLTHDWAADGLPGRPGQGRGRDQRPVRPRADPA